MRTHTSGYFAWLMVGLGGIFYCYEYMVRVSPSVMIPELMKSFSIQATEIGILSAFYYWGYVAGSLLVGPMIDKYAPKRVLVVATLICAIGCCCFAMSQNLYFAQLSRLMIGFGSAFAFIGLLAIGAMWLPPNHFGRLAGTSSMLGMLSAMIGQNWFSQLIVYSTWQKLSYYSGGVGMIVVFILFFLLKDLPTHQIARYSFKQLMKTFKKLGQNPLFLKNCIIGFTTFLPIILFSELWGVPFLEFRYQLPRELAARYVSMVFMGWALGGPSFGFMCDIFKKWQDIFWLGTLATMVISIFILYALLPIKLLPYVLFLFGFCASSHVLVFVSSRKMSSPEVSATALSITNLLTMSAGVIMHPIIGSFIDYLPQWGFHFGLMVTTLQAYQLALGLLPITLLIALFLIKRVGRVLPLQEKIITPLFSEH